MKLSNKSNQVQFLKNEFEQFNFELFSVDINDNLFSSCIVCWSNSADDIINFWKDIQSLLSAKYQPEGEYAKWNIYLIYLNKEKLSLDEKYKIENDKYFSRKIVLDGLSDLPNIDSVKEIINCELFGHDMHLSEGYKSSNINDLIDSDILNLLKNIPLGSAKDSKEARANVIKGLIDGIQVSEN